MELTNAPTVQKIQAKMSDVIEHFKNKGYVSINSKFERNPKADSFELIEHSKSEIGKPYDFTLFSAKSTESKEPVQKLAAYKQFSDNENYSMVRDDYNEKGQCIRHIFDEGNSDFANQSLVEYEYAGDKLLKENEFGTYHGITYNEVKTLDPKTGRYNREMKIIDKPISHYADL
jgi:hypothetical protein